MQAISGPSRHERPRTHHHRLGQGGKSPQHTVSDPLTHVAGIFQVENDEEKQTHQKSSEPCGPDTFHRKINPIWKEGPGPPRPDRYPKPEELLCKVINRETSQRGNHRLEYEQDE